MLMGEFEDGVYYLGGQKCSEWENMKRRVLFRRAEMLQMGEFEDCMSYLGGPNCSKWENMKTACTISEGRNAPNGRI